MATMVSASNFYKSPSRYLGSNEIVTIEDTKSHKLKSILIPEKLIEKYRYIIEQEMESAILKSFTHSKPQALDEAFGNDLGKIG